MSYLQLLDDAFEELAAAKNLDDLIRRAVLISLNLFKFDRAGILLFKPGTQEILGTWGTDVHGNLRDEHDLRLPLNDRHILHKREGRVRLVENIDLLDEGRSVGNGWLIQAAIFSGEELFGWIFIDNLVNQQPLTTEQFEAVKVFSNVLGQLIVRSKMEDTLLAALDSLASNEDLTMNALDKVHRLEAQIEGNRKLVVLAERLSGLVPMSTRAVGNLLNFINLLTPEQFGQSDQALLESAKKSADRLSRIFRHFDQKVHDATDNDVQTLPAAVVQEYWFNQFNSLFRNTPHHLEVRTDDPTEEVSLPLILLTQLVKELIANSLNHGLEHCQSGRTIVSLARKGPWLTVQVEDTGPGLDEDQFEDVLKLFVTSKPNELLGSGLNVIQHYVERWLNGQLDLGPSEFGGLRCTLNIPIQQ
ncbi:HAMP domain-containing sensor histidine kinase [Reinekea sp. G2M2-21]|uniref:sensor histidine kinase n=1 Tax=Reinekea sp. G2M2-21 TaxID=2788942 RepID=UPI0018A9B7E3|nr:ATP-binding protein [Reinekea sp. G2M2-21]